MAGTEQETPDVEKSREPEQMATQPSDDTEESAGTVVAEDTEGDTAKTGAFVGAAKAIEDGMEFVGEKAPEVVSVVLHKVKEGVSLAYGTSSTLVREAYDAASDYADEYKHKVEIKRLKVQRDSTSSTLGSTIYTRLVVNEEPPENIFSDPEITSLLQRIQDLDNEVVRIGKELEND